MPNLARPNASDVSQTSNRSRDVVPGSGICARCVDGCTGNCEVFQSTFRGREVIYPSPYGELTAGGNKDYPVDYSHFNIQGYALGAEGLPEGAVGTPDNTLFTMVNTEVTLGTTHTEKLKMPIISGALGSTEVARASWEHFAAGAAISGVVLTCGENVCGMDPDATDDLVVIDLARVRKDARMDDKSKSKRIDWLHSILTALQSYKKMFGCEVLTLDSLAALYALSTFENPRGELFYFFEQLRDLDITSFLISEMPTDREVFGLYGVEDFLADGIIHLNVEKHEHTANLYVSVNKMRKTNHDRGFFPLIYNRDYGFEIITVD